MKESLIGALVFLCSQVGPSIFAPAIPGIISVIFICGISSFLYGVFSKAKIIAFTLGILFGYISYVGFNFSSWQMLAPMIATFNVMAVLSGVILFLLGRLIRRVFKVHGISSENHS